MPYIDIDLDDIYGDLTQREKKELVGWLKEDGFIEDKYPKGIAVPNYTDLDFDEALVSMVGKRHLLTVEEESAIFKISEKFRNAGTKAK